MGRQLASAGAASTRRKPGRTGTARSQPRSWPDKWVLLGCLLLAVAVVVVYLPVSHHPFLDYDDQDYVINNVHIKHGFDAESIRWAFTTFTQGNWHPLTWFSHILDFELFGLNAAGHHVINLVLHLANALLLFWVLWRATGYGGRSLMVAALFALHPINVESVAWIAERKNLLSMLFFLLALGAYRWYAREPRGLSYGVVTLLYVFGLMSKPQVITFPFVLLLWDYWPLQRWNFSGEAASRDPLPGDVPMRDFSGLVREKLPLFALCAASAVLTMKAQRAGGAISLSGWSPRLQNAIVSYARYLGKAIWPTRLAPMYVFPEDSLKFWQIATALLILLAITALVLWAWRHRYLPVGWFWFLGTLVPMIGFVQVGSQAMADRYAYLPFVGLFLMVTWGVADVFAGLQKRGAPLRADRKSTSPAGAFVTIEAGVAIAVLLVLTVLTARQVGRWKDNITLWEYALKVTSNNYVAETNLGIALEKDGRTFDAMPHFFRAIAMHPAAPGANLEVAMYYQRMGMLPQAIAQDKKLLSLTQSPVQRAEILSNMGFAYGALGDYPQARASFQEAVNDNPNHSRAWMGLGVVSQKSGELTQAIDDYTHSVQGHPSDVTYLLLARALKQSGRNDEAEAALRSAKLLSQNFEQTQRMADALIAH